MLADQADAVVMVERTQPADSRSIEVLRPVAPGENVIHVGEDVRAGDLLFQLGHAIRPQDIGGLLALGINDVPVIRRPRVAIVSTGDELVPPDARPERGQIRDINTYTIAARVTQCGAEPVVVGLVPDEYAPQLEAARNGIDSADMLVFSAGSSLSSRDMTAAVFNQLGEPGVLLHGISIKPGKPTIVAVADGKTTLRTARQPRLSPRGVRPSRRPPRSTLYLAPQVSPSSTPSTPYSRTTFHQSPAERTTSPSSSPNPTRFPPPSPYSASPT